MKRTISRCVILMALTLNGACSLNYQNISCNSKAQTEQAAYTNERNNNVTPISNQNKINNGLVPSNQYPIKGEMFNQIIDTGTDSTGPR